MPIVAAHLYRHGQLMDGVAPQNLIALPEDPDAFIWVDVVAPTEKDMLQLQQTFALHPLAVEDAVKAHQLPKLDIYADQLFVIARTAQIAEDAMVYGETAVFVGRRHIIVVRHSKVDAQDALRRQMEAAPALLAHGVDYVLHRLLDAIVDAYLPIVDAVEDDVLRMEQAALATRPSPADVARIFKLRRELTRFQRALAPMNDVVGKLAHLDLPCIDPEVRPYFRDVLDHLRRVDVMVGSLRDVLSSVFEVSTLLEQQRQGDITRKLAAWAAILAVPTAIAGIYGMNFNNMPELRTQYGYFVVLGVIAVVCGVLYSRFRKVGWL